MKVQVEDLDRAEKLQVASALELDLGRPQVIVGVEPGASGKGHEARYPTRGGAHKLGGVPPCLGIRIISDDQVRA